MYSKAVVNQDAWSLVSSFFGFGIKYMLKSLEANHRVGITRVGARILSSKGRERGLVTSIDIR